MDSHLIYYISEKTRHKITWINSSETEWNYCGAGSEVRLDLIAGELDSFFEGGIFYIAVARSNSFATTTEHLLTSISQFAGMENFLVWNERFQKVMEFSNIGVFRKGVFNA